MLFSPHSYIWFLLWLSMGFYVQNNFFFSILRAFLHYLLEPTFSFEKSIHSDSWYQVCDCFPPPLEVCRIISLSLIFWNFIWCVLSWVYFHPSFVLCVRWALAIFKLTSFSSRNISWMISLMNSFLQFPLSSISRTSIIWMLDLLDLSNFLILLSLLSYNSLSLFFWFTLWEKLQHLQI